MDRWLLITLLFADGQTVKDIGRQLWLTQSGVQHHLKRAKGVLLGVTRKHPSGTRAGVGTRMELRAALVEIGWLTE